MTMHPADASSARRRSLSAGLALAVALAAALAGTAALLNDGSGSLRLADERVIAWTTGVTADHPALLPVLIGWQWVFEPRHVVLVTTLVCVLARRRFGRPPHRAAVVLTALWACWLVTNLIKAAVQRPRPEARLVDIAGWSYPSSHASGIAAGVAVLVVLTWPVLRRRARCWAVALAALLVGLTGADRVFLGVHYLSDVLAGTALGLGLVAVAVLVGRGAGWWTLSGGAPRSRPP